MVVSLPRGTGNDILRDPTTELPFMRGTTFMDHVWWGNSYRSSYRKRQTTTMSNRGAKIYLSHLAHIIITEHVSTVHTHASKSTNQKGSLISYSLEVQAITSSPYILCPPSLSYHCLSLLFNQASHLAHSSQIIPGCYSNIQRDVFY